MSMPHGIIPIPKRRRQRLRIGLHSGGALKSVSHGTRFAGQNPIRPLKPRAMSTTYTLDTKTDRAHPTPKPMKRLTVPAIRSRKTDGKSGEPLVMLTAYTVRMAQLLDPHCDLLLVGDSLGQVVYGLDSTIPVSLDMMIAHGAAVVRGSYHSVVVVDMPFGSYEESKEHAIRSATRVMKETGAAAIKMEGGEAMAETVAFLSARGHSGNGSCRPDAAGGEHLGRPQGTGAGTKPQLPKLLPMPALSTRPVPFPLSLKV